MVKRYNNAFITGDLHLGDVKFHHEARLIDEIKKQRPDLVVFGGDTFDPWRGNTIEELVARYNKLFLFLKGLKSRVVFLRGNHDPEIDFLRKMGFGVKKKFKYVSAVGKLVKIIHGHEFDRDCRRFEFLTRRFVYLEEKINRLFAFLNQDKIFRTINLLGNIDLVRILDNFQKRIKSYHNTDILIFGHTHVPLVGQEKKVEFYNWGGWQNDLGINPGIIVNRGGEVNLVQIK